MFVLLRKRIASLSNLNPTRHDSLPVQTLLFSSSANVSVPTAKYLRTQHHISRETALKVSLTISHIKNPHNTKSTLSCLEQTGFSGRQINRMISKYPKILNLRPLLLKDKLSVFQDKGFSTRDTIALIYKNPGLLFRSSENCLKPSIDALKSALGSTNAACRVLKKLPWILEKDLSKALIPNMEFLKKCSELSSYQVARFMKRFPRFFLLSPETIKDGARKVCETGLEWTSKTYLNAVRVVCMLSEEKLELKMRFFRGLSFSENDVMRMFNKCQNVFCCSEKNIQETIAELLSWRKADLSLVLTNTGLLMFSLENRIKPRLEVIKILDERGLLPKKLSMSSILQSSNNKFLETYVLPNLNALGDDCVIRIKNKLSDKPQKQ